MNKCSGARERSEQWGASEGVSCASERANGWANGVDFIVILPNMPWFFSKSFHASEMWLFGGLYCTPVPCDINVDNHEVQNDFKGYIRKMNYKVKSLQSGDQVSIRTE